MTPLVVIGINCFRENLREKLLYNVVLFALLLIGSSMLLSRLHLGEDARLILDLGLACINLFGVVIAVFIGIGLVGKEIEKKTIYTLLSKPVSRHVFLLGKYLGLTITLLVNTAMMLAGLLVVLYLMDVAITLLLFKAVALIVMELLLITAVALLCSTFTTSTLSAIFTLAVYVIGHVTGDLKALGGKLDATGYAILTGLYYVLPNLERFNIKGQVIHQVDVPLEQMALILTYGVCYTVLLLLVAAAIFQRREFK